MTITGPAPMTPPDCDLRGFGYMPLHGARLFTSDFYAEATADEFRAAMHIWWSAWIQVPSASLPVGDNALAVMAGYGRDTRGWLRVKGRALHGFIVCSDGRQYHPFLAELAVASFELRLKNDTKRGADRERLRQWREARRKSKQSSGGNGEGNTSETSTDTPPETQSETPHETRFNQRVETPNVEVEEKRREEKKGRAELRSDAKAASANPPRSARDALWQRGIPAIRDLTGLPDNRARSLLGRLLKTAGDDCARTLQVIETAQDLRPVDPVAWLTKAAAPDADFRNGFLEIIATEGRSAPRKPPSDPVSAFLEAHHARH